MKHEKIEDIIKKYPYAIKKRKINNRNVLICGVEHIESFYLKEKDFFDDIISYSCGVISEYSPEFDKKDVREDVRNFFHSINYATFNHKKDLFYVDAWRDNFEDVDVLLNAGGLATTTVGIASFMNHCYKKEKYSRRQFIKRLGLDLSIMGIGTNLITSSYLSGKNGSYISYDNKFTARDWIEYGANDYRNCRIAEGINQIIKNFKLPQEGYLLSIHGAGHTKPIVGYLDHNILRFLKLKSYFLTFGLNCERYIKKYKFKNKEWVLTKKKKF